MSTDDRFELGSDRMDGLLKKAKRKSIGRQAGISALVVMIVLAGYVGARGYLLNEVSRGQLEWDIAVMKRITQPNVEVMQSTTVSEGLFRNTVQYRSYKLIEGQPVKWEDRLYEYSMWNTFHPLNRPVPIERDTQRLEEAHISFNAETAQRELRFYLPSHPYPYIAQDVDKLDRKENKVAEIAVSFDKPYTVEQIKGMLPNGVHAQWYWVDAYDEQSVDERKSPEHAGAVYGFKAEDRGLEGGDGSEKDFILAVQNGLRVSRKYREEFQKLYDYLRAGKSEPTVQDIRILGVVVTGTAKDLQQLKGLPFARATVQGAMTDEM